MNTLSPEQSVKEAQVSMSVASYDNPMALAADKRMTTPIPPAPRLCLIRKHLTCSGLLSFPIYMGCLYLSYKALDPLTLSSNFWPVKISPQYCVWTWYLFGMLERYGYNRSRGPMPPPPIHLES